MDHDKLEEPARPAEINWVKSVEGFKLDPDDKIKISIPPGLIPGPGEPWREFEFDRYDDKGNVLYKPVDLGLPEDLS